MNSFYVIIALMLHKLIALIALIIINMLKRAFENDTERELPPLKYAPSPPLAFPNGSLNQNTRVQTQGLLMKAKFLGQVFDWECQNVVRRHY